eukprot:6207989-Prymnesium_polylepis.1
MAVIRSLIERLQHEVFLEGDFVLNAGDAAHAMYYIVRGDAVVLSTITAGSNVMREITRFKKHDYFGEVALVDESAIATHHVLSESVLDLYALYRAEIEEVMREIPELTIEMYKSISRAKTSPDHEGPFQVVASEEALVSVMSQLATTTDFPARLIQVSGLLRVHGLPPAPMNPFLVGWHGERSLAFHACPMPTRACASLSAGDHRT